MDAIQKIERDWRADKWNFVAKSTTEARTDLKSCLNDLKAAMRAFPPHASVRSAVDMLELYQRILFNTMDAHDQTLASKDAEMGRLRAALKPFVDFPPDTLAMPAKDGFTMTVRGFHLHNAVRALTQPTE